MHGQPRLKTPLGLPAEEEEKEEEKDIPAEEPSPDMAF